MKSNYLSSVIERFQYYRELGDKTISQVPDDKLNWMYNEDSNSIATIVKHMWGNMMSRWTDFLNSDGEKDWRMRDAEFENDLGSREEILAKWNEGWDCLFAALSTVEGVDLESTVEIRKEPHTIIEAVNRQLAHYAYHVGQMVFLGKMICGSDWKSLSIPKGGSQAFNDMMMGN